jgi:hypothetical protein
MASHDQAHHNNVSEYTALEVVECGGSPAAVVEAAAVHSADTAANDARAVKVVY